MNEDSKNKVLIKSNNYCLDSNIFIGYEKNDLRLKEILLKNNLYLPIICQGEILIGYIKEKEIKFDFYYQIIKLLKIKILNINEKTTEIYAKIFIFLKKQDKKVTQNDLWILAICIQNNLNLLSYDNKLLSVFNLLQKEFIFEN
jgi:tRNA(fMet)-specific endonuclease VapC